MQKIIVISILGWYEMTETSRFSEGDESIADFSVLDDNTKAKNEKPLSFMGAFSSTPSKSSRSISKQLFREEIKPCEDPVSTLQETSNGSSTLSDVPNEEDANLDFPSEANLSKLSDKFNEMEKKIVPAKHSGLFLYVDIHGHASKRGIFM